MEYWKYKRLRLRSRLEWECDVGMNSNRPWAYLTHHKAYRRSENFIELINGPETFNINSSAWLPLK